MISGPALALSGGATGTVPFDGVGLPLGVGVTSGMLEYLADGDTLVDADADALGVGDDVGFADIELVDEDVVEALAVEDAVAVAVALAEDVAEAEAVGVAEGVGSITNLA